MTRIADAHIHLFEGGFAGVTGGPPAGPDEVGAYERLREAHGVVRALVVGYEGDLEYAGNNDFVLGLARERDWIAPLAYLHATAPPPAEGLRELRARGAVGYSIYLPAEADAAAVAAWPHDVLAELAAQRAILSLNSPPPSTALLAPFVDAVEPCPVLFSHLGLPEPGAGTGQDQLAPLLALAGREHVRVKVSGLYGSSDPFPHRRAWPFVDALVEAFGPARLLWGSDFSPALDHVSFAQTLDVPPLEQLSAAEAAAIRGENLLRLLG
jgi:L-fuconolactonase